MRKPFLLCLLAIVLQISIFGQRPTGFMPRYYEATTKFLIQSTNSIEFDRIAEGQKIPFQILKCNFKNKQLDIDPGLIVEAIITKVERPSFFKKQGKLEIAIQLIFNNPTPRQIAKQKIEISSDKLVNNYFVETELELEYQIPISFNYNQILLGYYNTSFADKIDEYIKNKNLQFIIPSSNWQEQATYKLSDTQEYVNTKVKQAQLSKNLNTPHSPIFYYANKFITTRSENEKGNTFRDLYFNHYNTKLLPMELQRGKSRGLNHDDPDIYRKSEYRYLPKSGLILLEVYSNSYGLGNYTWDFYIMHPIFGPLKFTKTNGVLKLLENQQVLFDINTFKNAEEYLTIKEHYPFSYGNQLNIHTLDGSVSIDGEFRNYEKYLTSDYFDERGKIANNENFILGKKFITIRNDKEYKYYPTYEEKEVLYRCCGLPRIDLINPNFYYFKSMPDKQIVKYTLLNKNLTPLTAPNYFDEIIHAENNYFITKYNGRFGLLCMSQDNIEKNQIYLFENNFDKIIYLKNGLFELTNNGVKEVVDFKGNVLSRKTN